MANNATIVSGKGFPQFILAVNASTILKKTLSLDE